MSNFNHERMAVVVSVTRQARVALSTAFAYCAKREAFGKIRMDQPVVRHRLAKCGAELESQSAWLEQFAYQLSHMTKKEADVNRGGMTALAKAQAGRVLDECSRCAVLLFRGNGCTRTGQGELVESQLCLRSVNLSTWLMIITEIYREVNIARIPGGSEDVMFDLAIRQLAKNSTGPDPNDTSMRKMCL
jgi:acyl-CoA dehydrogenase